jgi:hypothetical protein
MIARYSHGAESHVIVDQIENTVEAVIVSHLDTEGSSKQKGKGRRSRKSSSMGKRPMKKLKTIKWPRGICEQECTDGVVCNSVLAHTNLWINQHDLDSTHR